MYQLINILLIITESGVFHAWEYHWLLVICIQSNYHQMYLSYFKILINTVEVILVPTRQLLVGTCYLWVYQYLMWLWRAEIGTSFCPCLDLLKPLHITEQILNRFPGNVNPTATPVQIQLLSPRGISISLEYARSFHTCDLIPEAVPWLWNFGLL